ncbi:phosphotransferase family protein [Saccharothrix variisporea]|uniref:Phosphotransferase family enzyme n=1 Tax=Saccharothrix variisporea TaxID=543527 RepID=A0A495XKI8_9PSEU|nr:phosphotransferase [Saccharothrix variisporea]RKT72098.1 phosphotransferase family enzyme [Saccharothrix variisporea]
MNDTVPVQTALVAGMAALVDPVAPPVVLAVRGDVVVVRVGDVVLKAHEADTDAALLRARCQLAGDSRLGELFLAPLLGPVPVLDRLVTGWPLGVPVPQGEPDTLPLEEAGRMLARLHDFTAADFAADFVELPPAGAWERLERAVVKLPDVAGAEVVRRAFDTVEPARAGTTLIHGDWHLGQLVSRGGYRLIDVDDLGAGDPAWDLARPAALFAAGVLEPRAWSRLLDAYLDAGGTGIDRADPWAALEGPARGLVVQMAARALAAAERDGKALEPAQTALLDACARIASRHEPMPRG